jgi:tight adherence protein B
VSLAATALGALVAGGCWLIIDGWVAPDHEPPVRRHLPVVDPRRAATAGAAGAVLFLLTRWPVGLVGGCAAGWALFGLLSADGRSGTRERTAAIALWCEMLRDAVGTARGLEGVLAATSQAAPLPIRDEVRRMADLLETEGLDPALAGLADDLDHPTADLVVAALRLSATSGGGQLRAVLASLAGSAYDDASSRARIDVARERPRAAMRYTALIIGGFVLLLVAFSRSYLAPYSSPTGQAVLVVVGLYWAAGFAWMRRMGREEPAERLILRSEQEPAR